MKTISTILAGICAVLVVVTGTASLFLFNVERSAFSSEPYKRAFEKLGLYDRMPSILAASLFSSPASVNGTENPIWALMTSQGLESGIAVILPPADLKLMTDGALDSLFVYINGQADSALISLVPIKNRFSGPEGVEAVLGLLQSQPACTAEQLIQITLGALSGSGFALCNPPPEAVDLFRPLIQSQLQYTASLLPNELPFVSADRSGTQADPRVRLKQLRAVMRITPVVPILLILLMTIFVVRSLKTFLTWWGLPILATGLFSFFIALVGAPLIGTVIQFMIETQASQILSTILLATLRETTSAVAREIMTPNIIQGAVLAVLGFAMSLVGFFLRRPPQLSAF